MKKVMALTVVLSLSLVGCTSNISDNTEIKDGDTSQSVERTVAKEVGDKENVRVNDDFLTVKFDIHNRKIILNFDKEENKLYHYRVYYTGKVYKTYNRSENCWSIEYDFSKKDINKIKFEVYDSDKEPEPFYDKTVVVATYVDDNKLEDMRDVEYYTTRYPIDLSVLREYGDNLKGIAFGGDEIKGSLTDLSELQNLESIRLISCDEISGEIGDLKTLKNLKEFCITDCNSIEGYLDDLSEFESLTEIELSGLKDVKGSIEGIASLKNLTKVSLNELQNITGDISVFNKIPQVQEISIMNIDGVCGELSALEEHKASIEIDTQTTSVTE